jgi:hypothetical protein
MRWAVSKMSHAEEMSIGNQFGQPTGSRPGRRALRALEPGDEKRQHGDGRDHDHSMLNLRPENNPVTGQPVANLIAHGGVRTS